MQAADGLKPLAWRVGGFCLPVLSFGARIELGCFLVRLQAGWIINLSRCRPLREIGKWVFAHRTWNGDACWLLIFRIDEDMIVIADLLPETGDESSASSFCDVRRCLCDYDHARTGQEAGWTTGDAIRFLQLSPEETAVVHLRLRLSTALERARADLGLTQEQAARRLGSSQSRVAKMEGFDSSASLESMIMSLIWLGVPLARLGAIVAGDEPGA